MPCFVSFPWFHNDWASICLQESESQEDIIMNFKSWTRMLPPEATPRISSRQPSSSTETKKRFFNQIILTLF